MQSLRLFPQVFFFFLSSPLPFLATDDICGCHASDVHEFIFLFQRHGNPDDCEFIRWHQLQWKSYCLLLSIAIVQWRAAGVHQSRETGIIIIIIVFGLFHFWWLSFVSFLEHAFPTLWWEASLFVVVKMKLMFSFFTGFKHGQIFATSVRETAVMPHQRTWGAFAWNPISLFFVFFFGKHTSSTHDTGKL